MEPALALQKVRSKLLISLLLGLTLISHSETLNAGPKELRINIEPKFPVDPLFLKSMVEYDVSLMLYRSWFDYDNGRRADKGQIIKSWSFDQSQGRYFLDINDVRWSDETKLTAEHLIANLNRVLKSDTLYGKALFAIIDARSLKLETKVRLSFQTLDRKPSEALFNQLGSVFLSIVHPDDLDKSRSTIVRNRRTIGPYKIESIKSDEVTFIKSPYLPNTNKKAPTRIIARPAEKNFSLDRFLSGKTWANFHSTTTLISRLDAERVLKSGLPYWSRGIDRVTLFKPLGNGDELQKRRGFLRYFGKFLGTRAAPKHPLQVKRAQSLQPIGYPLQVDVKYEETALPSLKAVRVLTYESPALDFYRDWLEVEAKAAKIKLDWEVVSLPEFLKADWDKSGCDLALFTFGVADPEPSTWLGLVFGSSFVSLDNKQRNEFQRLMGIGDHSQQVDGYRTLLKEVGQGGGYLPLLHSATISLGRPGINFDLVHPLDETVDFSKLQLVD